MPRTELKIATVIGARPQFIKAAAVSRAISQYSFSAKSYPFIKEVIIHTGQHYDKTMSKLFFDELHIPEPDYNLEVGSANHGVQTGTMLARIEKVLLRERPNIVLTYGDTNSTLAGVLAASKLHMLSAHVEAGLRSYNRRMPEEINRIVADKLSNILFCPTETAVQNLEKEGITGSAVQQPIGFDFNSQLVLNVGDVMYDSILFNEKLSQRKSRILAHLGLIPESCRSTEEYSTLCDKVTPYCLATIHRPENTDDPENLSNIFQALAQIAIQCLVIVPLHPRTKRILTKMKALPVSRQVFDTRGAGIMIIDPVGYLDMIQLEKYAYAILTDSGGVQKEAFILRKPCITLRNETEWIETVQAGWNVLVGADPGKIQSAFFTLGRRQATVAPFSNCASFDRSALQHQQPYGDGNAAQKILQFLSYY